jgi:hypothetical protein
MDYSFQAFKKQAEEMMDRHCATYEEVTTALENRYSDHHLEEALHTQLKRMSRRARGSLQKSAAVVDHLAHRAHINLLEQLISIERAHSFADGVRERKIKTPLKKTLNEAVRPEYRQLNPSPNH